MNNKCDKTHAGECGSGNYFCGFYSPTPPQSEGFEETLERISFNERKRIEKVVAQARQDLLKEVEEIIESVEARRNWVLDEDNETQHQVDIINEVWEMIKPKLLASLKKLKQ